MKNELGRYMVPEFAHELSTIQFLLPPVCSGILFIGMLLNLYMTIRYKSLVYFSILLLALSGLIFVTSETLVLTYGAWLHNQSISVQIHRIEQLGGATFFFTLPFSMNYLLRLNPTLRRVNYIYSAVALGFILVLVILAYAVPDSFISDTTFTTKHLIYEADYGRGMEGPLYRLRDALLGISIIYAVSVFIYDLWKFRDFRTTLTPTIGILIAMSGAIIDTIFVHTGMFIDLFPELYFSRFSLGLTVMIVMFMSSLLQRYIDTAREVEKAHQIITISEERYRMLVDGTDDCIFRLSTDFLFLTANNAFFRHLAVSRDELRFTYLYDIIAVEPAQREFTETMMRQELQVFLENRKPLTMKLPLKSRGTGEPLEYQVRFEHITIGDRQEVLARATSTPEDTFSRYVESETMKLSLGNYLIAVEEVSKRLVQNLNRYMKRNDVLQIRLGLREMIVNAIEHGNLDISFDDKSAATGDEHYLEFVASRQHDPKYRDKRVRIEYSMNAERLMYKIADEGNGFDYRGIIERIEREVDSDMLAHGRGLILAHQIFDEIQFNNRGNQVLLVKRFDTATK